jgi:hypothetical protein
VCKILLEWPKQWWGKVWRTQLKVIILKWIFHKQGAREWTELIWLRTESTDGLLWTREWTFCFHKMPVFLTYFSFKVKWRPVVYYLTERLLPCQQGICAMEFMSDTDLYYCLIELVFCWAAGFWPYDPCWYCSPDKSSQRLCTPSHNIKLN